MFAFAGTPNQYGIRHGRSFLTILASAWVGLLLGGAAYTLEPPRLPTDSAKPVTFLASNEFEAVSFIEDGTNAAPLSGAKMYLPWFPCVDCARAIVQAGIVELVAIRPDTNDPQWGKDFIIAQELLDEAGVRVRYLEGQSP
jgi:hypothetical protein